MSKSVSHILQQAWRVVRLFSGSLVAQLYLLPHNGKLTEKLVVSAVVAAGEATYRQISPAGSARVLGTISQLFGSLASVASATSGSTVSAADIEKAVAKVLPERLNLLPIVHAAPEAEVSSSQPGQTPAPSEAPTGADGQPLNVVHSGS